MPGTGMLTDISLGNLDARWRDVCGAFQIGAYVAHSNVNVKTVYQPPVEPAFVSWVVMWQESDGTLKMSFTQVDGDVAHYPPTYNMAIPGVRYYLKTFRSDDGGATWQDMHCDELQDQLTSANSHAHYARCIERPDGSLLRVLQCSDKQVKFDKWPGPCDFSYRRDLEHLFFPFERKFRTDPYHPRHTLVQQSRDGGMTWQTCHQGKPGTWKNMFRPLADGSLCATGTCDDHKEFALYESTDGGATWSDPVTFLPDTCTTRCSGYTEENDLVEISDGRLLIVHRSANSRSWQSIVRRRGSDRGPGAGRYELESFGPVPIGDDIGQPFLHKSDDGTLWHCGGAGAIWATLDEGTTWQKVVTPRNLYYPQLLETRPGHIMSLSQYGIGDDAFPHFFDSSIRQVDFDFERRVVIEQKVGDETSIMLAKDANLRDLHMHVEARLGYAVSFLFHASADAGTYHAYRVELSDRVDDHAPDWEGHFFKVMHSIVKVVDGRENILWSRGFGRQARGGWVEMQVKVDGDLIQGAFRTLHTAQRSIYHTEPYYISVRDGDLDGGTVGLRAEAIPAFSASPAAFRNLAVYDQPMMMRDHWRQENAPTIFGTSTAFESDRSRGEAD
jgi:hypothetical protein